MSKKHFIALAEALTEIRRRIEFNSEDGLLPTCEAVGIVEDELVRFCRSQNGQFLRERFIGYSRGECGPSGGTVKK